MQDRQGILKTACQIEIATGIATGIVAIGTEIDADKDSLRDDGA